jgi:hypothetical protein
MIQDELRLLQDLIDTAEERYRTYPYWSASYRQLGRISEVLRRVLGENPPRLVRVRAVALMCGYDTRKFLTTEQLSCAGAGAFITWAFVPHGPGADLDTVPLRQGAMELIEWAIAQARAELTPADIEVDEARQRQARRAERHERKKREAASLRTQGQPGTA